MTPKPVPTDEQAENEKTSADQEMKEKTSFGPKGVHLIPRQKNVFLRAVHTWPLLDDVHCLPSIQAVLFDKDIFTYCIQYTKN